MQAPTTAGHEFEENETTYLRVTCLVPFPCIAVLFHLSYWYHRQTFRAQSPNRISSSMNKALLSIYRQRLLSLMSLFLVLCVFDGALETELRFALPTL